MMIRKILYVMQKILLHICLFIFMPATFFKSGKRIQWVVGVEEIASMLFNISSVLKGSVSVNLSKHPFYTFKYTHNLAGRSPMLRSTLRILYAPVLFAYYLHHSEGFFYLGSSGFLLRNSDGREYEFKLIKKMKRKLVCYFLGTDIRSPKLTIEQGEKLGLEVMAQYQIVLFPEWNTEKYENSIRRLAQSTDRYADAIFNASVDQKTYITRKQYPFLYFYPDNDFHQNIEKFQKTDPWQILHAPSSPFIKGTQLVRAAIKKLQKEGYSICYIELIGMPHSQVLKELKNAHIVLNQFYAFMPSVFGIEAMANNCALITSADPKFEPSIPKSASQAWFITQSWEVYDNLKCLLDNRDKTEALASRGFLWAKENASFSASSKVLLTCLNEAFADKL